MMIFTG